MRLVSGLLTEGGPEQQDLLRQLDDKHGLGEMVPDRTGMRVKIRLNGRQLEALIGGKWQAVGLGTAEPAAAAQQASAQGVVGTPNQVIATSAGDRLILSLPQDIHIGAIPIFAGVVVGTVNGVDPADWLTEETDPVWASEKAGYAPLASVGHTSGTSVSTNIQDIGVFDYEDWADVGGGSERIAVALASHESKLIVAATASAFISSATGGFQARLKCWKSGDTPAISTATMFVHNKTAYYVGQSLNWIFTGLTPGETYYVCFQAKVDDEDSEGQLSYISFSAVGLP